MKITSSIFSKEFLASLLFRWIAMSFFPLFHPKEERKGEDEGRGTGGRALTVREYD